MNLEACRRRADTLLIEYRSVKARVRDERDALERTRESLAATADAQGIFQRVAQATQELAHRAVASVVTRCLRTVGFDYDFKIDFLRKRGKTEARLLFVKDGIEHDPLRMSGGGAIDVASFALRLCCVMLASPKVRRLLVLDEPMRHLSEAYRPAMAELLEVLAEELGFQLVIVTHAEGLKCGKVIQL